MCPKLAPGLHLESSKTVISWFLHNYTSVNVDLYIAPQRRNQWTQVLELFLLMKVFIAFVIIINIEWSACGIPWSCLTVKLKALFEMNPVHLWMVGKKKWPQDP